MKQLSDCRVLLVDDAKANLDILVEGLKADHKLSLALNGEMALQIAARTPPDLVLLDIMMPGLDGYEVCRRLRQMPETAEVPIMFLSSLEDVQNKTRGFEAGANDYLTKPFEMLEVKARVRSLLKAKAYSDAVKEQIASGPARRARNPDGHDPARLFGRWRRPLAWSSARRARTGARSGRRSLRRLSPAWPERLVLFLGDVSGKGIPASMFMVRAISLARLLGARHRRAGAHPRAAERRARRRQSVRHVRDVSVRGVRSGVGPAHDGQRRALPSGAAARRRTAALGGGESGHRAGLRARPGISSAPN